MSGEILPHLQWRKHWKSSFCTPYFVSVSFLRAMTSEHIFIPRVHFAPCFPLSSGKFIPSGAFVITTGTTGSESVCITETWVPCPCFQTSRNTYLSIKLILSKLRLAALALFFHGSCLHQYHSHRPSCSSGNSTGIPGISCLPLISMLMDSSKMLGYCLGRMSTYWDTSDIIL